jgi:hypothetical protein
MITVINSTLEQVIGQAMNTGLQAVDGKIKEFETFLGEFWTSVIGHAVIPDNFYVGTQSLATVLTMIGLERYSANRPTREVVAHVDYDNTPPVLSDLTGYSVEFNLTSLFPYDGDNSGIEPVTVTEEMRTLFDLMPSGTAPYATVQTGDEEAVTLNNQYACDFVVSRVASVPYLPGRHLVNGTYVNVPAPEVPEIRGRLVHTPQVGCSILYLPGADDMAPFVTFTVTRLTHQTVTIIFPSDSPPDGYKDTDFGPDWVNLSFPIGLLPPEYATWEASYQAARFMGRRIITTNAGGTAVSLGFRLSLRVDGISMGQGSAPRMVMFSHSLANNDVEADGRHFMMPFTPMIPSALVGVEEPDTSALFAGTAMPNPGGLTGWQTIFDAYMTSPAYTVGDLSKLTTTIQSSYESVVATINSRVIDSLPGMGDIVRFAVSTFCDDSPIPPVTRDLYDPTVSGVPSSQIGELVMSYLQAVCLLDSNGVAPFSTSGVADAVPASAVILSQTDAGDVALGDFMPDTVVGQTYSARAPPFAVPVQGVAGSSKPQSYSFVTSTATGKYYRLMKPVLSDPRFIARSWAADLPDPSTLEVGSLYIATRIGYRRIASVVDNAGTKSYEIAPDYAPYVTIPE